MGQDLYKYYMIYKFSLIHLWLHNAIIRVVLPYPAAPVTNKLSPLEVAQHKVIIYSKSSL